MSIKISVIGMGSWGQAIAFYFGSLGHEIYGWQRRQTSLKLKSNITMLTTLSEALSVADVLFVSLPVNELRSFYESIKDASISAKLMVWGSKGMEINTGDLPHMIFEDVFSNKNIAGASFSGPTFAEEIIRGLPGAACVASKSKSALELLSQITANGNIRTYPTEDILGVEIGGATKNIYAIGCGIIDSSHLGENAQAAFITRSLYEMTKLGEALGAQTSTFFGLSGLGDMILTCTGNASRNRRFGKALVQLKAVPKALKSVSETVEGYYSTKAVYNKASELKIEMPIVNELYNILYDDRNIDEAISNLVARNTPT